METYPHNFVQAPATPECPHQPVTRKQERMGLFNCPRCTRVCFTGLSHCPDCDLPLH